MTIKPIFGYVGPKQVCPSDQGQSGDCIGIGRKQSLKLFHHWLRLQSRSRIRDNWHTKP